jgi:DNA-binding NtrC family response regulator
VADAANLAQRAMELSSRHSDRMETALAHITLGRVQLAQGKKEGYASLQKGQELLRSLGSPLPLAQALIEEGELRQTHGDDLDRAELVLEEGLGVLQGLGLTEIEVEALITSVKVATARGSFDRASELLDRARRLTGGLDHPALVQALSSAQVELEERLVESSVTNLGAFRTAGRIEELVESRRPYAAKLNEVVQIMAQAVEADGAALFFASEEHPEATLRIGNAAAARVMKALRESHPERPEIVLDAATLVREPWSGIARTRKAASLLVIPVYGNGSLAYLYLDRLVEGHGSSFGPGHLNLCLALLPQLEALVDRAVLEAATRPEEDTLRRRTFLADVVTQNPEMLDILRLVEKINRTDLTVLLQGETGTGKTLIARAVHLSSDRASGPFVTVDCAALPENLLESELFGYVKGAFTGASRDKKGLFEEADGGTIFLDEVGKAGLGVQRRLLHLLDKGEVRPVGATSYRKLNVRVICATSAKTLLGDQGEAPFIKDLYYRLNDIIIRVPSLRERPEDIPLLAEYFLETFNGQTGRNVPGFNRGARQRLVRFDWPGNVRELEKVVRRAAILAEDGEPIGVDLLPQEVLVATEGNGAGGSAKDNDLRASVHDMERRLVQEALDKHGWNKTRAAQELGLSRKGLKNKIARYGLEPGRP